MFGGETLDFEIRPNPSPVSASERDALMVNPGFGRVFTDHMVTIRYADGKGWYDARVEARAPIPMDPATAVLHYAQEIFEGLKAYRAADGGITMFRPDANARRFRDSAARMGMAQLPEEVFLDSLRHLITIDRAWVPTEPDSSLYLRQETDVVLPDGRVASASAYFYNAPLGRASRIRSGDYLEHVKARG